jgi:very-short-patch-repair endonuclease
MMRSRRGLHVDTQIGCSGYRIDLAIRDDQRPDRYLLGIECDGATYHSSKTARDRDRLRQTHLEGLGWHIHRIWSSDWIANPNREIEKTLEALRLARMKAPPPPSSEAAG